MDIGGIGEFSLIASIRRRMEGKYPPEVALGIGDDCAVLHPQAGMEWVITTDTQVEDVHFRRAWLTPYQIGWRAMAVNLSDIAAMGAQPFGALAALALPVATEATFFDQLLDGLCDLGLHCQCPLIGGNLARDPAHLSLTLTVLGHVPRGQSVLRAGAKVGDEIWVSGQLGGAAAGLRTCLSTPSPLLTPICTALRQRYAQPQPRVREAIFLRASGMSHQHDRSQRWSGRRSRPSVRRKRRRGADHGGSTAAASWCARGRCGAGRGSTGVGAARWRGF